MKIAVLLPNYNHAKFIGQAIKAIQRQSHRDWELAIVDDASTDDSRELIAELARQDERIITKFLPNNGGVTAALTICYAMTTAPVVLGTAADDYIVNSRYFEAVNAAFAAHPQAACAFAKASLVSAESGDPYFVMAAAPHSGWIAPRQCLKDFLNGRMFIHGGAVAWRRAHVDRVGGYDSALGPRADFFVSLALSALGGAVFIDEIATVVRFSDQAYGQSVDDETYFRQFALAERKLLELDLGYGVKPRWRRTWRDNIINERLANRWQRWLLDAVRKPIAALDPWHVRRFQAELGDIATRLRAGARDWENTIDSNVAAAQLTFDRVAGPLPPPSGLRHFVRRLRHKRA
jgi:glycosyltransferase involved in cell wall biosynthesis